MASSSLSTYLTDHLAGSAAAIALLEREAEDGDTFFVDLLADVQVDRDELERLIEALGAQAGTLKQAGAWIFERLSRLKIAGEALGDHDLEPLLELEVLVLGIRGKHALWTALREIQRRRPRGQGPRPGAADRPRRGPDRARRGAPPRHRAHRTRLDLRSVPGQVARRVVIITARRAQGALRRARRAKDDLCGTRASPR